MLSSKVKEFTHTYTAVAQDATARGEFINNKMKAEKGGHSTQTQ